MVWKLNYANIAAVVAVVMVVTMVMWCYDGGVLQHDDDRQ